MNKRFEQFNWYISQIKAGETAIIIAPDYVVIDWTTWKNINKEDKKREIMFVDDCSEISEEVWNVLESRLKKSNLKTPSNN